MMNYEIFKEVVAEKFLEYLPAQYQGMKIDVHPVEKVNVTMDAINLLGDNEVSFIEIATPVHKEAPVECNLEVIKPTAVIKTATMSIAISNDISEQLLSRILQEVSHA